MKTLFSILIILFVSVSLQAQSALVYEEPDGDRIIAGVGTIHKTVNGDELISVLISGDPEVHKGKSYILTDLPHSTYTISIVPVDDLPNKPLDYYNKYKYILKPNNTWVNVSAE